MYTKGEGEKKETFEEEGIREAEQINTHYNNGERNKKKKRLENVKCTV